MSWCNKLASTPGVGIRFTSLQHRSSNSVLDILAPLLDNWQSSTESGFSIEKQDSFALDLISENGFFYSFTPQRIFVDFRYRMKLKHQSAGPPTAELLSEPAPYTQLLDKVIARLIEAVQIITRGQNRQIDRVGIVSTTHVRRADAPPGIVRAIDYHMKPWAAEDSINLRIPSPICKTDDHSDRCLHAFTLPEGEDALLTIALDYQRTYDKLLHSSDLPKNLGRLKDAALEYFERVAEGRQFHVENPNSQ